MYTVTEFTFIDEDTNSEFTLMCNGKCFFILIRRQFFGIALLGFFLRVAEEFELEGHTVDDSYGWVITQFLPLLRGIPPLYRDAKPALHDFFSPKRQSTR